MFGRIWFPAFLIFVNLQIASQSKQEIHMDGEIIIGGGYAVHAFERNQYGKCGAISPTYAILSEAHLWATDYVNEHLLRNLTNIQLGAYLVDTCNNDAIGIQRSVGFIENIDHDLCYNNSKLEGKYPFIVTGAYSSAVAHEVNYLLQAYCIPLIASMSSSIEFDNEKLYPYFLRTVSSDKYQVRAVARILQEMGWNRVTVIFESTVYGDQLKDSFQQWISSNTTHICVESYIQLSVYKEPPEWDKVLDALKQSDNGPGSPSVIVLFLDWPMASQFFENVQQWQMTKQLSSNRFQYVGVDGWSSQIYNSSLNSVFNNSITVEYMADIIEVFKENMSQLQFNATSNDWIQELIQDQNNCSGGCYGNETLLSVPPGALRRATKVFQAVHLIGQAILKLHSNSCHGKKGFCMELSRMITGMQIHKTIEHLTVNVDGVDYFEFFNGTNSGLPKYSIYQFQDNKWIKAGHYKWKNSTGDFDFMLNHSKLTIPKDIWSNIQHQQNQCQPNCDRQYGNSWTRKSEKWECCHVCHNCSDSPFHHVENNSDPSLKDCRPCPTGYIPDISNYTNCVKPPHPPVLYELTTAVYIIFVAVAVCQIFSLLTLFTLIRYRNTPMALAGTLDLQYAFCIGVIFQNFTTILAMPSSSIAFCTVAWASCTGMLGYSHAIVLVKALRLARPEWFVHLFAKDRWTNKKWSKVLIANLFLLQLIVVLIWATIRTPHHVPIAYKDIAEYKYSCSAFNEPQTYVLLVVPVIYLCCSLALLRSALRSPFLYVLFQTRFLLVGCIILLLFYGTVAYSFNYLTNPRIPMDVNSQFIMLMWITISSGIIFWFSMAFPVLYVLVFKRKTNFSWSVQRKRAQLFKEGPVLAIVTPVVYPSPRQNGDLVQ